MLKGNIEKFDILPIFSDCQLEVVTKELSKLTQVKDDLETENEALRKQTGEASDQLAQRLRTLQENYKVGRLDATKLYAE